MHKYNFLIAYDIADPKRLRKIAKIVERRAMRIQYSLYLLDDATQEEALSIIDAISDIFHKEQDDIRIYRIKKAGIRMGCAVDIDNPYII